MFDMLLCYFGGELATCCIVRHQAIFLGADDPAMQIGIDQAGFREVLSEGGYYSSVLVSTKAFLDE